MKKLKIIIPVVVLIVALITFLIVILYPRVKIYNEIQNTMEKWGDTTLGTAVIPYTYEFQPEEDWVVIENRRCRFSMPACFTEDSDELPEDISYYKSPDETEYILIYEEGEQAYEPILNKDEYDEKTWSQLKDGFEQLGYDIPKDEYSSLKTILSVTDEDYDFWNINKAKAYSVLASYKTDSYASIYCLTNGTTRFCYYYESEDLYFIASEVYHKYDHSYNYTVRFYHPDNLHYAYDMTIVTPKPEVAFAIINSFELTY